MRELNNEFGIDVAIKKLRPNARFVLENNKFTQWWDPDGLTAPSWDEVQEQFRKDADAFNAQHYARMRVKAYPSVGEQLDMLWHAIDSDINLKDSEWFAELKNIKETYPVGLKLPE